MAEKKPNGPDDEPTVRTAAVQKTVDRYLNDWPTTDPDAPAGGAK